MKKPTQYENQKICFLNRYDGEGNYTHLLNEPTFLMLDQFTLGEFQVYFYLCTQVPHTINGKIYDKNKRPEPFSISVADMMKKYPNTDRKTLQEGINKLIKDGILKCANENLYLFDSVPLGFRCQTIQEHEQLNKLNAEQLYNNVQTRTLTDLAERLKKEEPPKSSYYTW